MTEYTVIKTASNNMSFVFDKNAGYKFEVEVQHGETAIPDDKPGQERIG